MNSKIIVKKDFANDVHGRFKADHKFNGTRFRNEMLIPRMRMFDSVIVDLNGLSYGSSFLEEAFGGLVRYGYFSNQRVIDGLNIIHNLPSTVDRITHYINEAQFEVDKADRARAEQDYPIPG